MIITKLKQKEQEHLTVTAAAAAANHHPLFLLASPDLLLLLPLDSLVHRRREITLCGLRSRRWTQRLDHQSRI